MSIVCNINVAYLVLGNYYDYLVYVLNDTSYWFTTSQECLHDLKPLLHVDAIPQVASHCTFLGYLHNVIAGLSVPQLLDMPTITLQNLAKLVCTALVYVHGSV